MKIIFLYFNFFLVYFLSISASCAAENTAQEKVGSVLQEAIQIHTDTGKNIQGDKDVTQGFKRVKLYILSTELIDFRSIVEVIYGQINLDLEPIEKNRFINYSIEHIKEKYWNLIKNHSGDIAFETEVLEEKSGIVDVYTKFSSNKKNIFVINFKMIKKYNVWRAIDLLIDDRNIKDSLITQYKQKMEEGGWNSLLKFLEKEVKAF